MHPTTALEVATVPDRLFQEFAELLEAAPRTKRDYALHRIQIKRDASYRDLPKDMLIAVANWLRVKVGEFRSMPTIPAVAPETVVAPVQHITIAETPAIVAPVQPPTKPTPGNLLVTCQPLLPGEMARAYFGLAKTVPTPTPASISFTPEPAPAVAAAPTPNPIPAPRKLVQPVITAPTKLDQYLEESEWIEVERPPLPDGWWEVGCEALPARTPSAWEVAFKEISILPDEVKPSLREEFYRRIAFQNHSELPEDEMLAAVAWLRAKCRTCAWPPDVFSGILVIHRSRRGRLPKHSLRNGLMIFQNSTDGGPRQTVSCYTGVQDQSSFKILKPDEVAHQLGVKPSTLAGWRSKRFGPPFTKIGGIVGYLEAELEKWIISRTSFNSDVPGPASPQREMALPVQIQRATPIGPHGFGRHTRKRG